MVIKKKQARPVCLVLSTHGCVALDSWESIGYSRLCSFFFLTSQVFTGVFLSPPSRIWDTASGQCLKTLIGKIQICDLHLQMAITQNVRTVIGCDTVLSACFCGQMMTTLRCRLSNSPPMGNTSWPPRWTSEYGFLAPWQFPPADGAIAPNLNVVGLILYVVVGFFFFPFCCWLWTYLCWICSTLKLWDYSKGKVRVAFYCAM